MCDPIPPGRSWQRPRRSGLTAVIDLHAHILPGLDDGVRTLDEAGALARAAAAAGVTAIAATPHVRDDYPTSASEMEAGVDSVRRRLAETGVRVEVLTGGEVSLDRLERLAPEQLARFSLAGSGRYLLVEFPYYGWPLALEAQIRRLRSAGLIPLLAHPERNQDVQRAPERLERALRTGALVQVTIDSLAGTFGRRARKAAERLLDLGFVHVLASDAHSPRAYMRGPADLAALTRSPTLARSLTIDTPTAIAAGNEIVRD